MVSICSLIPKIKYKASLHLFWAEVKNKKAISIHLPNCRRMDIVVFRDLAVSLLNCLS